MSILCFVNGHTPLESDGLKHIYTAARNPIEQTKRHKTSDRKPENADAVLRRQAARPLGRKHRQKGPSRREIPVKARWAGSTTDICSGSCDQLDR